MSAPNKRTERKQGSMSSPREESKSSIVVDAGFVRSVSSAMILIDQARRQREADAAARRAEEDCIAATLSLQHQPQYSPKLHSSKVNLSDTASVPAKDESASFARTVTSPAEAHIVGATRKSPSPLRITKSLDTLTTAEGTTTSPDVKVSPCSGGIMDEWASKNPREFPQGDVVIVYDDSECGGPQNDPVIGWAAMAVSVSMFQRRMGVKKFACLGVYVCPEQGCTFRERPKVPRRGDKKYSTGGKLPPAQKICHVHKCALEHIACKCTWVKSTSEDGKKKVTHFGVHAHPVPQAIKIPPINLKQLERTVKDAPELLPSMLDFGMGARKPAVDIHPYLVNTGSLSHSVKKVKSTSKSVFTGNPISTIGGSSEDAVFEMLRSLDENPPHESALLPGFRSSVVADSCLGGIGRKPFIAFQTASMKEMISSLDCSMQTDTIEGFLEPVKFQGMLNVTVTSVWDSLLDTQAPLSVTILFGKSEQDYKEHWNCVLRNCRGKDAEELISQFPGNTSDYSDALKNGFISSFEHTMSSRHNESRSLRPVEVATLWRLCDVHYKRSVQRIANISRIVHPERANEFRQLALSLISADHTFDSFMAECMQISSRFPAAKGWLCWYLQAGRVEQCFPACKSLSDSQMTKFKKIKPDTNAQEGLGGFMQALTGYKKLTLRGAIEHLVTFVLGYERKRQYVLQGHDIRYGKKRPSRAVKKKGEEPKHGYRPPDSARELVTSGFSAQPPTLAKYDSSVGVPQMTNLGSTCYMSCIVQCLLASKVAVEALKRWSVYCVKSHTECSHAVCPLVSLIMNLDNSVSLGAITRPLELLSCARTCIPPFPVNTQNSPQEFLDKMLDPVRLENEDSELNRALEMRCVRIDKCCTYHEDDDTGEKGCGAVEHFEDTFGFHLDVSVNPDMHIQTLMQLMESKMDTVHEPSIRCQKCYKRGFIESTYRLHDLKDCEKKVLCVSLDIFARHRFQADEKREDDEAENVTYKVKTVVPLSSQLDISSVIHNPKHAVVADLVGYVSHIGDSPSSGHFTNVTKNRNGHFIVSDDLKPESPIDLGPTISGSFPRPYLLFFELKSMEEISLLHSDTDVEEVVNLQDSDTDDEVEVPVEIMNLLDSDTAMMIDDHAAQSFLPTMTSTMEEYADSLIRKAIKMHGKHKGDILAFGKTHETCRHPYSGAPMYEIDRDTGAFAHHISGDDAVPVSMTQSRVRGLVTLSWKSVARLTHIQLDAGSTSDMIIEEVLDCFATDFNKRESDKSAADPNYRPCHMFSPFCVTALMNLGDLDADKYTKNRLLIEDIGGGNGRETIYRWIASDVFQCSRLFFPRNIDQFHWVFHEVDVSTLKQRFFCSLLNNANHTDNMVAKRIHLWLQHHHTLRHRTRLQCIDERGRKVDCPRVLRDDMFDGVQTNHGNEQQGSLDCLLHTAVVPVLIADGIHPGRWLGGDTREEREAVGVGLRRRMAVQLKHEKFMFKTVEGNAQLKRKNDKASRLTEVKRESKMEQVENLRRKLSGRRKVKKSEGKPSAVPPESAAAMGKWEHLDAGERSRGGKDPVCYSCNKTIARKMQSRLFFQQKHQTRSMAWRTRKLQIHCNTSCILNMQQPRELAGSKSTALELLLSKKWEKEKMEKSVDLGAVLEETKEELGKRKRNLADVIDDTSAERYPNRRKKGKK